jgi:protein phosphatase
MLRISSAVASHPGLRREENEDSFSTRDDLALFRVADGLGGHAAGEIASRLAVDTIVAFISDTRDADINRTWPFPYDHTLSLDGNRLKAAFRLANRKLGSAVDANDTLRGMATTAAAVLFGHGGPGSHGGPTVAHVGDSRVYLWREGSMRQVTQDHSWVSEQVRAGVMTEKDARRHPWRNVVTRALAGGDDPEVDVADVEVRAGDRLILCSDGLHGVVLPDQLETIVKRGKSLSETCQALVDAANAAGGPDNITVVLLQVDVA